MAISAAQASSSPGPATSVATIRMALPWLDLELESTREPLRVAAERALRRFATGWVEPSERTPTLRLELEEADARTEAAEVWRSASVSYQFVRGTVGTQEAGYATEDGSLVRVRFAEDHAYAAIRPSTPSAPYSTWPDLLAAPLSEHWRAHGCFPLHAAAVELDGRCAVLPAASGSGKTTLCLALARHGATWRADDKLLFTRQGEAFAMASLLETTNLSPVTVRHFEWLAFAAHRPPLDATNSKRAALMEEASGRVDLSPFRPSAILFPRLADTTRTSVRPLAPGEALLRLAAQSPTSPEPARLRTQIEALGRLAAKLPAFEIAAGADVLEPSERVAELVRASIAAESA